MKNPVEYCLDTNVLLRVLVRENEQAYRSSKLVLERVQRGEIRAHIHQLVIAEITWTLQSVYKQSKETTIDLAESILNLNGLDLISGFDQRNALRLYQLYSVKYIDACLASIKEVKQKKWAIVSYDTDFKKLPVVWLKPDNIS